VAGLDPAIHGPGEVEMALGEAAMMKGSLPAGRPVGIGPSFAYLARGWPVNLRIRSGTVMTTGEGAARPTNRRPRSISVYCKNPDYVLYLSRW
jgi:hypothetical protein